jgi:hypothetical protein
MFLYMHKDIVDRYEADRCVSDVCVSERAYVGEVDGN